MAWLELAWIAWFARLACWLGFCLVDLLGLLVLLSLLTLLGLLDLRGLLDLLGLLYLLGLIELRGLLACLLFLLGLEARFALFAWFAWLRGCSHDCSWFGGWAIFFLKKADFRLGKVKLSMIFQKHAYLGWFWKKNSQSPTSPDFKTHKNFDLQAKVHDLTKYRI